jgi:hypothetical protein
MQPFAPAVYDVGHSGFISAPYRSATPFRSLWQSAGISVPCAL